MKNNSHVDKNSLLPDIFVGQVLYKEVMRKNVQQGIVEVTVKKVGRRYFYVCGEKFPIDKETLEYTDKKYVNGGFKLYRYKQEINDRYEKAKLFNALREHFTFVNFYHHNDKYTLEQLRQVCEILGLP